MPQRPSFSVAVPSGAFPGRLSAPPRNRNRRGCRRCTPFTTTARCLLVVALRRERCLRRCASLLPLQGPLAFSVALQALLWFALSAGKPSLRRCLGFSESRVMASFGPSPAFTALPEVRSFGSASARVCSCEALLACKLNLNFLF